MTVKELKSKLDEFDENLEIVHWDDRAITIHDRFPYIYKFNIKESFQFEDDIQLDKEYLII